MSIKLRAAIAERISEILKIENPKNLVTPQFLYNFELRKNNEKEPELHFPVNKMRNLFEKYGATTIIKRIAEAKYDDKLIKAIKVQDDNSRVPTKSTRIIFELNNDAFVKDTFETVDEKPKQISNERKKIIVEYSSPNIAKPFHVGHLRSTIIGNFIANLHKHLGNNVIRLNYLGDWGTQFGLLKIGIDLMKLSDEDIQRNPIQNLYNAYVMANKAAQSDETIAEEARKAFQQLESGENPEEKEKWETIRRYTVDELKLIYQRLNVEFDEYAWESEYSHHEIQNVLNRLESKGLLLNEIDGRKIVEVGDRRVPVIKSDGSTLYLARDIAAILDRFTKHKFDKIFYVVDNAQADHFNACFHVAGEIEEDIESRAKHIKFGRIKGMSTRKGTVIFLQDVLNEARDVMMEKQLQSPTTKVNMVNMNNQIADILGVSAVIVNDLKQRRQRDYEFDWNKILQVNGDTGIKLQYTHCRISSLLENIALEPAEIPNATLLNESEAIMLIIEIAKFPEVIYKSLETLEACVLVNYLFSLSNAASRALKCLNVKNQGSTELQKQRLLLFDTSRRIISKGMQILGLRVLDKM